MAITSSQIQELIDAKIRGNSKREVTGTVLNNVLTKIIQFINDETEGSGELSINVTPIIGGANNRILYQGAGKVTQSSNLIWDQSTSSLGISKNPSAKLDIKSAGNLSSDLSLKITNNAGTLDYFKVNGLGEVEVKPNGSTGIFLQMQVKGAVFGGVFQNPNGSYGLTANGSIADFYGSGQGSHGAFYCTGFKHQAFYVEGGTGNGIPKTGFNADYFGENSGSTNTAFKANITGAALENIGFQINVQNAGTNTALKILNGDISFQHGSKIGASSTDKFAFWGATPRSQQTLPIGSSTNDVISFLQKIGLCRNS